MTSQRIPLRWMGGILPAISILFLVGSTAKCQSVITVSGKQKVAKEAIWLSHEHILVDFIGADHISKDDYDRKEVSRAMLPYLKELNKYHVKYFVDATPPFLGRDPMLLKELSEASGLTILTTTGLYGARQNKYIPAYAFDLTADKLARKWIKEFKEGIDGTGIRPGLIKISVDGSDPLDPMHAKIVKAAALTHLATGLTIASHTGKAIGLWPQLEILKEEGVSPSAFIWVHAQNERNTDAYIKASKMGCWISFDGIGWNTEQYVEKLLFAKKTGFLDRVLISHDAGWFDPQKDQQEVKPYTNIFEVLIPKLREAGFTDEDFNILLSDNPARAFGIGVKREE